MENLDLTFQEEDWFNFLTEEAIRSFLENPENFEKFDQDDIEFQREFIHWSRGH